MKAFILALILAFSFPENSNFSANGDFIVWEKTFTAQNLDITSIAGKVGLKVTSNENGVYKGKAKQIKNNCDNVSALTKNDIVFDFEIITEGDTYTVTVSNLGIVEKFGPMQARSIVNKAEKHFMHNGTIKANEQTQNDMACIDHTLNTIFSVNTGNDTITNN